MLRVRRGGLDGSRGSHLGGELGGGGALLGIVAQLAFGAYRLDGGQAQLQVLCNLVGEMAEHGPLRLGQLPRHGVDRGNGAEMVPVSGDDRGGGVEPQPQLATYQRMVEGARIRHRVVDHVRALGADRRRAQSRFGTDLRDAIQSLGRGEPDPVGIDDLLRWLAGPATGLPRRAETSARRLTAATVSGIEAATAAFGAQDATIGGGLSREAAVGQLKHAVDLLRDTSYTDAVGNRMLAAVAELAGMVGWMSHDVHMAGPAQRYFVLGLHAARESTDPRAGLLRVSLLADMARQMRDFGRPDTGLQLIDAALAQIPCGRHPAAAAMLWNLKARMLAAHGNATVVEMTHAIGLAEDLLEHAHSSDEDLLAYTGVAELAGNAALAWQDAATHDRDLARHAEQQAIRALANRPDGYSRSKVFDHISLSASRFTLTEAEQAAADGHTALDLAAEVATSTRVLDRLSTLLEHSRPYAHQPDVRDFRERLTFTLATTTA